MSLERKLPLLMTAVLAGVLALSLFLTYGTLTRSAEGAARDRLTRAARQVAATVQTATMARVVVLRAAASEPAIVRALRTGDTTGVGAILDPIRTRADSLADLPVEVWDTRGRRIAFVGPDIGASASRPTSADGSPFGPMYPAGGRVYFWIAAPVVAGGDQIGMIAQQRRVGGPREASRLLQELIGEDVTLYMRNTSDSFWVSAPGAPAVAPARRETTAAGAFDLRPRVGRTVVGEAEIAGTPWITVLETPVRSVHDRARATITTLSFISVLLITGGAAASWAISRRVTKPLVMLTDAAESIAEGRDAPPVEDSGADEIGRLAASFNQMSSEVTASRRELEQRIREAELARAEAERASRAKSDFLAVMSHELRTPLNAIGGYAQLLELGVHGPVTDAQRDALARIARSQGHLLRLINDVLSFAKIDAGQLEYAITDVVVNDVVADLEPLVAPQVQAKGLRFTAACGPTLAARADADKLQQALLNIVTNAIKFTPTGGTIAVDCSGDGERVFVRVRDTGSGIPPDQLTSIFEPFVQGDRALNRPHEGVGLGLAISRDLVRGMGGDITAQSAIGVGSVFTIALASANAPSSVLRYASTDEGA